MLRKRTFMCIWLVSMGAIIWLSLTPDLTPSSEKLFGFDKICHFTAYFWLSILSLFLVSHPRSQLIFLIIIAALGMVLEMGQSYVFGRTASIYDVMANFAGILIAIIVGTRFRWPRP